MRNLGGGSKIKFDHPPSKKKKIYAYCAEFLVEIKNRDLEFELYLENCFLNVKTNIYNNLKKKKIT